MHWRASNSDSDSNCDFGDDGARYSRRSSKPYYPAAQTAACRCAPSRQLLFPARRRESTGQTPALEYSVGRRHLQGNRVAPAQQRWRRPRSGCGSRIDKTRRPPPLKARCRAGAPRRYEFNHDREPREPAEKEDAAAGVSGVGVGNSRSSRKSDGASSGTCRRQRGRDVTADLQQPSASGCWGQQLSLSSK